MYRLILIILISGFSISSISQWKLISPTVSTIGSHGFWDVHFVNKDTGFVIGWVDYQYCILRTLDGGTSWDTTTTLSITSLTNISPMDIDFPNDTVGYVVGNGEVMKTTDCGENWIRLDTLDLYNVSCTWRAVKFVNQDSGFVAYQDGGAQCLRTYDGGWTWFADPVMVGARSFNSYDDIYTSCTGGWAILDNSSLTWTQYSNNQFIPDLNFWNAIYHNGKIIVTGDRFSPSDGIYAFSDDMGANWNFFAMQSIWSIKYIQFLNDTIGYATGDGMFGTIRTYDGGSTWQHTSVDDLGTGMSQLFTNFHFVDDSIGYAVSENGIYKTTDGGGLIVSDVSMIYLGLNSEISNAHLLVYPNPVQNEINFSGIETEISELIIYSLDGKEILRKKIVDENKIDVSELATGNYILKVLTESGVYSVQIFKE